jgi:hypothetical protein
MTATAQAQQDYKHGATLSDNPYKATTADYQAWMIELARLEQQDFLREMGRYNYAS